MKIADNFQCKWKLSCAYHKFTLFVVRNDEWDTKEDIGKSMKNALYLQQYGRRSLLGWSKVNNKKIKPVALAITFQKVPFHINMYLAQIQGCDSHFEDNTHEKIIKWC